jgi:DeoR/GlpR family transcriptional regulator of sugar metabolism
MAVVPLSRIDVIVTDDGAREEELQPLREAGIEVVVAPVLDEDRALDHAA